MKKLNENEIRRIIKEEKSKVLLERYLRREVRNALIESHLRLDEGFFDKITSALGKLGMSKITDKVSGAYASLQQKLGNDKEIPGIDALMGPFDEAKKISNNMLAVMKKTPVTRKSDEKAKTTAKEESAKMMQLYGKFLNQKLEGSEVTVAQAMEIAPSQKKQSKPHLAMRELVAVWRQINKIWTGGKRLKQKDQLIQWNTKLNSRIMKPYKGKKKI